MKRLEIDKRRCLVWVIALTAGVAIASGIVINGAAAPYNQLSNVQGTTVDSDWEVRTAGLSQAAATYRLTNGLGELPVGSRFQMRWGNSSHEVGDITSTSSSVGAVPVPGTQFGPNQGDCNRACHSAP